MDYHSSHGQDVSSFDLPSTHRMPTVSAAQAYEGLGEDGNRFIPTSLDGLDGEPAVGSSQALGPDSSTGCIAKGHLSEIWGPPGVGKTTFGIQLVANALRDGGRAVWVDGFHPVCSRRLAAVCGPVRDGSELMANNVLHFQCPSLPHFIALLCRPSASSIPSGTSLIVVDSLSALLNHAFPRTPESRISAKAGNKAPSTSARRQQAIQYISAALQKLAATRNLAVVVLTQCATRMQAERGATIIPAINAVHWDQAISTRLVLLRDWFWQDGHASSLRFVGVQKLNGRPTEDLVKGVVAFDIESEGIVAVKIQESQHSVTLDSTPAPKRKIDKTEFEIPDSEDEDYGWGGEDPMPDMPSQWQGSEDLLGQQQEAEEDEEEEPGIEHHQSGSAEPLSDAGSNLSP